MNVEELIPKNKHDFESVEKLKTYALEDLRPILPELLEWLQDMNWPIASELQKIIVNFEIELVPHIQRILQTDDGVWKYWILSSLLNELPNYIVTELRSDLERIRDYPTDDEIAEELGEIVEVLLKRGA